MLHGLRHALDPGTSSYAALKMGAVATFAGAQIILRRRAKHRRAEADALSEVERQEERRPAHPRSKKKRRRRR